jgi:hypothetical protein
MLALSLGGLSPRFVLAWGTEVVGRPSQPLANQEDWAPGLRDTLDNENRVYSVWVNGNETFYYRGSIPEMNAALSSFSKVKQKGIRVVVQKGAGQTKMIDGTTPVPYDWSITVPSGLYLQAARLGQIENPVLFPTFTVCLSGREELGLLQIQWPTGIPVLNADALKSTDASTSTSKKGADSSPEFVGTTQPITSGVESAEGAKAGTGDSGATASPEADGAKPGRPGETPGFVGATEPITSGADGEAPHDPQALGFSGEQTPIGAPEADVVSSGKESRAGNRKPARSIAALFDNESEPAAKEPFSSSPESTTENLAESKPLPRPTPDAVASPTPRPAVPRTSVEQSFLVQRVNSVLKQIQFLNTGKAKSPSRSPRTAAPGVISPIPPRLYSTTAGKSSTPKVGLAPKPSTLSLPPSRFPQPVTESGARTQPGTVTRRTVQTLGSRSHPTASDAGEALAPSPLRPAPVPDKDDSRTSSIPTPDEPSSQPRLTIHPLFFASQDGPLFRVDYTHTGSEDLGVNQALKDERLVLDGRELAPLQVPANAGPDRLAPGQSWRHTLTLSNFLPATSQPGRTTDSSRRGALALESGEHTLVLKFAGQTSEPFRFEWVGGPLLTE